MNPQFVPEEVVTAAKMNQLPKGVLGYAETATIQTGISAVTDLTGLSVTVTVVAGRRIRVSGQSQVVQRTSTGNIDGHIRESTTVLGRWLRVPQVAANVIDFGSGAVILTPTAGSHTYKLSLTTSAGTVDTQVSSTSMAFILVEDIGGTT